jgi:hypothetical protein
MTASTPAPTLALTRWVAGLIVLILADASQLLLFFPGRTDELFAWHIKPEITSLVLASAYVGGGYFFVRVFFGGPWERVAAGFPPVVAFVWLTGTATFLHLDRFIQDSVPFYAWVGVYVATPLAVPALYLLNRRAAAGDAGGPSMPRAVRLAMGGAGACVLLAGVLVFLLPGAAADVWPWTITPLTARIVAAVIALVGCVWLSVAQAGSWSAARIPLEAQAIVLGCLLWAAVRGSGDVGWDEPMAVVLVAGTAAMLLATVALRLAAARAGAPVGLQTSRPPSGLRQVGVRASG